MPVPFLLTPALVAAGQPVGEWRFHADAVLGTRLDIAISSVSGEAANLAAQAARAEIERLNGVLSWRHRDSELARLNRSDRMAVSGDLYEVLERAAYWREVSGGAFDERLGLANRLWREGEPEAACRAAEAARGAGLWLDSDERVITRGPDAVLDLDAIAKGYVVDRALAAARMASPEIAGAMVNLGGDIAVWRADATPYRIGLPQAGLVADNAPLSAIVDLAGGAIATSGRGQRDLIIDGRRIGPALARDGSPGQQQLCATARSDCAMDADALATIALVLPPEQSIAIADTTPGAALRIVGKNGRVVTSSRWQDRKAEDSLTLARQQGTKSMQGPARPVVPGAPAVEKWPIDWRLAIWYKLPDRRKRDREFREPYMAVWVTDEAGKAVRTLFMVGQNPDWQKDNFIWWGSYRARTNEIIDARSQATAPTGRYAFMWEGRDDAEQRVPSGKYTIHIETSRERGRHTHRTLDVMITNDRFEKEMPANIDEGGFIAVFGHYNDLLDYVPPDPGIDASRTR